MLNSYVLIVTRQFLIEISCFNNLTIITYVDFKNQLYSVKQYLIDIRSNLAIGRYDEALADVSN